MAQTPCHKFVVLASGRLRFPHQYVQQNGWVVTKHLFFFFLEKNRLQIDPLDCFDIPKAAA